MKKLITLTLIFAGLMTACSDNPTVKVEIQQNIADHISVGSSEYAKGDYESALAFLELALDEAYSIDNIPLQITVLLSMSELAMGEADYDDASNYIFKAKDLAEIDHNFDDYFSLFTAMGKYYSRINDFESSLKFYDLALGESGKREKKAIIYNNVGIIYRKQGDYDQALNYLGKAFRINWRKGIHDQLANNLFNIGEVRFLQEDWDKAFDSYADALVHDKISENTAGIAEDLKMMAQASYKMGNYERAVHYLERAKRAADSISLSSELTEIKALLEEYEATLAELSASSDDPETN